MTKRAELSTTIGRRFNRNYIPSHIWVKYTNNSFSTNQRQKKSAHQEDLVQPLPIPRKHHRRKPTRKLTAAATASK